MFIADHIRNFCVIAHIDHGKSTLADRFLELTHAVERRNMKAQLLDQMDLERERGITIKMQPVRMIYKINHTEAPNSKHQFPNKSQISNSKIPNLEIGNWKLEISDSKQYVLNLIDTPGHIDFSYEVSRALAAVEGAILLVDATQGVQAQTLTNLSIAKEQRLAIIPAVNKIDMPGAYADEAVEEMAALLGVAEENVSRVSAKTGEGVAALLERVINEIPPPSSCLLRDSASSQRESAARQSRALIFDSKFESHRGVIAFVRVFDGEFKQGDKARLHAAATSLEVKEVGVFTPALAAVDVLSQGEIGYVVTGIKDPMKVRIGDTIFLDAPTPGFELLPLPGYRQPQPVMWASFYPEDEREYDSLRDAVSRLQLNDASFTFEAESSPLLGRSFKCGFLGMLHLEIVTERLKREFSQSLIITSPSIAYEVTTRDAAASIISSPAKFPPRGEIVSVQEPWMTGDIIVPDRYLGDVLGLIDAYEGKMLASEQFGSAEHAKEGEVRMLLKAEMPLREIVSDFFDALKSATSGYASLAYEQAGMRPALVERLDIHVAEEPVAALTRIVSQKKAPAIARSMVTALKDVLPRQLFQVKIQAIMNGRIIASESLSALKKDVTGHLYGGDRSRKMKLWKKQKRGKKKLAAGGKVRIPPEAYLQVLKRR